MPLHLPSMNSLRAFEAAGRLGSFSLAAAELSLSQSTVSYRIQKLEESLGVLLFQRLTRRVELTCDGVEFLKVVSQSLRLLREGVDRFDSGLKSSLTVTLSTYFAARWLSPRLAEWTSKANGSNVHLNHDFRDADQKSDIIIHWSKDAVYSHPTKLLFATDQIPCCAPSIAQALTRPADVLSYPLLAAEPHMDPWPEWMQTVGISDSSQATLIIMPDSNVRIKAAVDGHGIVLGNQFIEAEIASGQLVKPFDICVRGPGAYYSNQSSTPELAARFIDWLKSQSLTHQ